MSIQRRALLYQVQTIISAAQLHAWNTTPIEVAPAPGANRIIQLVSAHFSYRFGTVPFNAPFSGSGTDKWTLSLDSAHPFVNDSAPGAVNGLVGASQSFIWAATQFHYNSGPTTGAANYIAPANSVNKPLMLLGDNDLQAGQIATSTRDAGGTGYAVNDTGTIDPSNNGSATYKVLTLGASNAVATYQITAPGNGYLVANALDTDASGGGTGFKVNVTAVNKGDGQLITTVLYAIIPLV